MASLSTSSAGERIIYVTIGSKRPKIKLGRMAKKDAESILKKIEHIQTRKLSREALDPEVATWLGSLKDDNWLFLRLVAIGLADARQPEQVDMPKPPEVRTLQSIVDRFADFKRPMIAKRSIDKQEECLSVLVECYGKDRNIASITLGDASEFESFGKKRGFSDAHQRTHNRYAKQLFAYAADHGWVEANPFRKLKSTSLAATARHYVTPEDTVSLLNACPGLQWKLLIGLARYAGLRVPSEAFAITWDMVDWGKKALCIPSKKTRRYAESRVCPILPELMELLDKGWDVAPEKATTILTLSVANVRRKLPAIIKEAKLQPWEDMFQTLRRSCETHFVSLGHPAHAVSNWLIT